MEGESLSSNGVLWADSNAGVLWIGGVSATPPSYTPHLERAALPKTPDIITANTLTSVYRLIQAWFKGWTYGY